MFGDAELAVEAIHRLGEDRAMGRATATTYSSTATMKEAKCHVALASDFVERAVGLPYLPGAGDHAAVFIGVGVAEHNFLLMVPGFEKRLVGFAGPKLAHDGWGVLEVFDGLEERDGLEAGIVAARLDADSAKTGEPEDVEHVFGAGGSADNVLADGFGGVGLLQFGDGAEGVENLGSLRREGGGKFEVGSIWLPCRELGDGGGVDAGVLADVQRLQVQTIRADLHHEWIDEHFGETMALVGDQAGMERREIAEKVGGPRVRRESRVGRNWNGGLRSRSQAHHDAGDEQTNGLVLETLFESRLSGSSELAEVAIQQGSELWRDGNLLDGARQLLEDVLQAAAVVGKQDAVGHAEGIAGGLRDDEGIAVAIAADP